MAASLSEAEAALAAGRRDEAINLLIRAVETPEDGSADAHLLLCRQLYHAQRYVEGEVQARAGVALHPQSFELWNILGVFLRVLRRPHEALDALDAAINLRPDEIGPRVNRGNILLDLGEAAAARNAFADLAARDPTQPQHQAGLGRAMAAAGDLDGGIATLRAAAARAPDLTSAWLYLAETLKRAGRIPEAETALDEGLNARPDDQALLEAKGVLLRTTHQLGRTRAFLETVIARAPDTGWAHFALGDLLAETDRPKANIHLRRAVALNPGAMDPLFALAQSLERTTGADEAAAIEEACRIGREILATGRARPHDLRVLDAIFTRVCDFDALDRLGDLRSLGRAWAGAGLNSFMSLMPRVRSDADRRELLEQHRQWGQGVEARIAADPIHRPLPRAADDRTRIGLMSSDLRHHAVSFFAQPLFDHLDRARFELYAYSFFRGGEDAVQKRLTAQATAFRWWPDISPREAAQRIADDQLDVLIELGGPTAHNKLEVMAYRPAPRQASWLGYPHSSGLSAIDGLICDGFNRPLDDALLIERPLPLTSWIALGAIYGDAAPLSLEPPCIRNGFVTFGTANQPYKYTRESLAIWAQIVAQIPGSKFLFLRPEGAGESFRANVAAAFAAEGVGADRLLFRPVRGDHLRHYGDIDITLDTFPLTGGTTTADSLWMGVPVVSLEGPAFYERLSRSILTNAGLADLVAPTLAEYVRIAVTLAGAPARLRTLRAGLRSAIRGGPLGQTERFAEEFQGLITRWVAEGL